MIQTFTIIVGLAVAGDITAQSLCLPIPGAALGMIGFAVMFAIRGSVDQEAAKLFDSVAPHMPLFFLPAATGIVACLETFLAGWLQLIVAITFGTAATLAITGVATSFLLKQYSRKDAA